MNPTIWLGNGVLRDLSSLRPIPRRLSGSLGIVQAPLTPLRFAPLRKLRLANPQGTCQSSRNRTPFGQIPENLLFRIRTVPNKNNLKIIISPRSGELFPNICSCFWRKSWFEIHLGRPEKAQKAMRNVLWWWNSEYYHNEHFNVWVNYPCLRDSIIK